MMSYLWPYNLSVPRIIHKYSLFVCLSITLTLLLVSPCQSWANPSSSSTSSSSTSWTPSFPMVSPQVPWIQNFRNAGGIQNVYRCASPDILGEKLLLMRDNPQYQGDGGSSNLPTGHDFFYGNPQEQQQDQYQQQRQEEYTPRGHDRFVLEDAHLILDLRSPSERNEVHSKMWLNHAGIRVFGDESHLSLDAGEEPQDYQPHPTTTDYYYSATGRRSAVRINVLSPPRLMKYIDEHWLTTPAEKTQLGWYKLTDGNKLHELRIDRLNEHGLAGLNEAILETGKDELCRALQTMTIHMESNPGKSTVIHCVQGKDRTGMLVMLLQSLIGVSDRAIIADYFMSNQMLASSKTGAEGSAALNNNSNNNNGVRKGKLDRRFFSGTNEQAMISTLHFLRRKYGSVSPGYLDAIGFDVSWRKRLFSVLIPEPPRIEPFSSRL